MSAAGSASRVQRRRQIVSAISSAWTSAMARLSVKKNASTAQPIISETSM